MVGLLDLPLELREPILLDVVLETTEEPPENPDAAQSSRGYREPLYHWAGPRYWKSLQRHAMSLLHINQQLRDEVIHLVLQRLGQRIDDAKMDVMYVQKGVETSLWATWLSAPFPTAHLNTLHVRIRSFQIFRPPRHDPLAYQSQHLNPSIGWDCKYWLNPWSAYALLHSIAETLQIQTEDVLFPEPYTMRGAHGKRTAYRTIQKLVIDIPFESEPQHSLEARVRCILCTGADSNISNDHVQRMVPSGKRTALVFARCLHEQLIHIIDTVPKYQGDNTIPNIIFERVGTIVLNVQGRPFRSLDLSQILAKLPHSEAWLDHCPEQWAPHGLTRAEYFEWKRAAEAKREAAGFEVVSPSAQEHNLVGSAGLIGSILAERDEDLLPEETISSIDATPSESARQPENYGNVAFTGNAVLIQEDGVKITGDASFYSFSTTISTNTWFHPHHPQLSPNFPELDSTRLHIEEQALEERCRDGELVLFKGEAILFIADRIDSTIASGEATFYGRAEGGSTEQPGYIEVDWEAWESDDDSDTSFSYVPAEAGGLTAFPKPAWKNAKRREDD